ncbi:MAG: hypothetical protein ACM3SQ_00050 [Betaproteobacteria bacterium]
MMLAAIALAAAFTLFTTAASAAPGDSRPAPVGPSTSALPPLSVTVRATSDITPSLVARMLDEAGAIWRRAGVTFDWRLTPVGADADSRARSLLVIVDDEPGRPRDGELPIGWIVFDDDCSPEPQLHVSYRNARELLTLTRQDRGGEWMPRLEEEVLLGRAMGRALAHELGHYLFASKQHTPRGLMESRRSAAEMFAAAHDGYWIRDDQRRLAAARIVDRWRIAAAGAGQEHR